MMLAPTTLPKRVPACAGADMGKGLLIEAGGRFASTLGLPAPAGHVSAGPDRDARHVCRPHAGRAWRHPRGEDGFDRPMWLRTTRQPSCVCCAAVGMPAGTA